MWPSANHSNIRDTIPAFNHPDLKGEGCFNHLGRAVLSCATKPVCIVGKLQHADAMEKLLEEGFACVGMSRQLVADPYWPLKVSEGRENEILYCTYCNAKCVASIMTGAACQLRSVGPRPQRIFQGGEIIMKKELISIALVLALTVTGCASAAPSSSSQSESASASQSASVSDSAEAVSSATTSESSSSSSEAAETPDAVSSASLIFYEDSSLTGEELRQAIRDSRGLLLCSHCQ